MNAIVRLSLLLISVFVVAGCSTPVAVDPETGNPQNANYQSGNFFGSVEGSPTEVFKKAIVALDDMGIYRTGELHKDTTITIFARQVLDKKVKVRIRQDPENVGFSEVRIRVGDFGDLASSQRIFKAITEAR